MLTSGPPGRQTNDLFYLDKDSGVLKTISNTLDRDTATGGVEYYDIVVSATDTGGLSITETIKLNLTGVNDNIPYFESSFYPVDIKETYPAGLYSK